MRFLLALLLLLAVAVPMTMGQQIGSYSPKGPPNLPDHKKTPGLALKVTKAQVCKPGYAKSVRDVTEATKNAVYKEYPPGAAHQGYCSGPQGCEIDHLISLEIGGSNDPSNLWPQPYDGDINAHMKDKLENFLHRSVCSGAITLANAQKMIKTNWISTYNKYVDQFTDADNAESEDAIVADGTVDTDEEEDGEDVEVDVEVSDESGSDSDGESDEE